LLDGTVIHGAIENRDIMPRPSEAVRAGMVRNREEVISMI
jgi:hypothetical protein